MDTNRFFEWDQITVRGNRSGVKKTTCPACSHDRKKKSDPCLYVNFTTGTAKCFNCDRLAFDESNKIETTFKKDYVLPPQQWMNYTNLSDNLVQWIFKERKITQNTLNQFQVGEEKVWQPAKQKEMNSIVFNYL